MQRQFPGLGGLQDALSRGKRRLEGKSFYLDNLKSRSAALLVEAISQLGGRVESFLHKDVSFVVTGSQEGLNKQSSVPTRAEPGGVSGEAARPTKQRENVLRNGHGAQPGTPRPTSCSSRGKALLEKAIRNNERLQGSGVLDNARSWGVKILHVDDFLSYLQRLTTESSFAKRRRPEKNATKCTAARVIKAATLKSPYLKIEDLSRKYKPLYMQSVTLPTLCYSGRLSPFEPPPPPRLGKITEVENRARERSRDASSSRDRPLTPLGRTPSPGRARKKNLGYCECCLEPFKNQEEHLQSELHRHFVLDSSNYSVVDQLVADMQPGFDPNPPQQAALTRLPTPPPIEDHSPLELEPLTDAETERAIQVLLTQGSSFNIQVYSPLQRLPSPSPDTLPPDVPPPNPTPSVPLADGQPLSPHTDIQLPVGQPLSPNTEIQLPVGQPLSPNTEIQLPVGQPLSPNTEIQLPVGQPLSPNTDDQLSVSQPLSPNTDDQLSVSQPLSPNTEIQLPVGQPLSPNTDIQLPVGQPLSPNTDIQLPVGQPLSPNTDIQLPVGQPLSPNTDIQLPVGQPLSPNTDIQFPVGQPLSPNKDIQLPIGQPLSPNTDIQLPVGQPLSPNTDIQFPVGQPLSPNKDIQLPIGQPLSPNTDIQLPVCQPLSPNTDDQLPVGQPLFPNTDDQLPVGQPLSPNTDDQLPVGQPLSPNTDDQLPIGQPLSPNTDDQLPIGQPLSPNTDIQLPVGQPLSPNTDDQLPIGQPLSPNTDDQLPIGQPLSPSPGMPQQDSLPLTPFPAIQPPDLQSLSPCPDTLRQPPDPYSQPPALSPQVPDDHYIFQPHSPYSEPPVLSPQVLLQPPTSPHQLTEEEDMEVLSFEMPAVEVASQSAPAVLVHLSTPLLPPIGMDHAGGVKGSNQEGLILGFTGLSHANNIVECADLGRSQSLPRLLRTTWNPRKRCRSASLEHNEHKRRRTSLTRFQSADPIFGYSACWTGQGDKSLAQPENEIVSVAEACLLTNKHTCQLPGVGITDHILTVEQVRVNKSLQQDLSLGEALVLKPALEPLQTSSAFSAEEPGTQHQAHIPFLVPSAQNSPPLPKQTVGHVSGLWSSSVSIDADQSSCPVAPNTRTFDLPLFCPRDETCHPPSSQDSHPSLPQAVSSVCIESALVPDMATLSPSSSDSDWDCELLSRLGPPLSAPLQATGRSCGLDLDLLQRPCTWMHSTSYESHLHSVLQPTPPGSSLCGEEMDPSAFARRTVMQSVEVLH